MTISALASAGGTLVLAGVTVASVRSANRGARRRAVAARRSAPPSRPASRTTSGSTFPGGQGAARATDGAVYFVISVRNVGTGIAVLHGWHLFPEIQLGADVVPSVEDFTLLTRDLYVAPDDVGFWQGAFRDPSTDGYRTARRAVEAPQRMSVDILYGDFEGGQRVISRFLLTPRETEDGIRWYAAVGRHWNVDRPQPRG